MSEAASPLQARQFGSLVDLDSPRLTPLKGVYRHGMVTIFSSKSALYLTSQQESGPFTVFVPDLQRHMTRCRVGQKVYVNNKSITILEAGLTIDLKGAKPWPKTNMPKPAPWPKITLGIRSSLQKTLALTGQQSLALAATSKLSLNESAAPGETPPLWTRLQEALFQLFIATQTADLYEIGAAANRLVGLGQGATPAGDDILGGYLAALWYTGEYGHLSIAESNTIRAKILTLCRGRTNALSAALLWAAAQGETGGTLKTVLRLLLVGDTLPEQVISNLSNVGHSSGLDGLAGIVILLQACNLALSKYP